MRDTREKREIKIYGGDNNTWWIRICETDKLKWHGMFMIWHMRREHDPKQKSLLLYFINAIQWYNIHLSYGILYSVYTTHRSYFISVHVHGAGIMSCVKMSSSNRCQMMATGNFFFSSLHNFHHRLPKRQFNNYYIFEHSFFCIVPFALNVLEVTLSWTICGKGRYF